MCYIVDLHFASPARPPCTWCPLFSSQFSQSGAQRLRFTVASRSFARAVSVLRLRLGVRYLRSPARLLAREAWFCARLIQQYSSRAYFSIRKFKSTPDRTKQREQISRNEHKKMSIIKSSFNFSSNLL